MTREIKFRAWFIKEKRMVTVDELMNLWSQYSDEDEKKNPGIKTTPHVTVINQSYGGDDLKLVVGKDCELMQYTGLKDKNGVEIYEGDIIKSRNRNIFEVIFDNKKGAFKLVNLENNTRMYFSSLEGEVIGNIYENKDLLK